MAKRMLVDATHPEETRVVVVDGTRLEEFDFETSSKKQLKGNIYLAKVVRIEPSLQAAFVEYGGNRHGFLAFSEIHPDYYQIPVADREKLLAEQAQRAMREADDGHGEGRHDRIDRSDIEDAREERARIAAERLEADATGADAAAPESLDVPGVDTAVEPDADLPVATLDTSPEEVTKAAEADPEPSNEGAIAAAAPSDRIAGPAADDADATSEAATTPEPAVTADAPPADAQADPADAAPGGNGPSTDQDEPAIAGTAGESPAAPVATDPSEAPQPEIPVETLGGDDYEPRPRRNPPPRQYKIQEVIKRRQILLVQVVKEERGNKGAALTTYLSLAGRYAVLMPNAGRGGGISRKITNAGDRKRMKEMLAELEVPSGMGVILRTAGLERSKPEIRRDYDYLMRLWDSIRDLTFQSKAPALIYEEGDIIKRSIRDLYNSEIEEVLVEGDSGYGRAQDFMRQLIPSHVPRVKLYRDGIPLFHRYQVDAQLDAMHSPIVQLRTGAYVVINPTEALVAIDVNSGRATKERNIEETALRTNLEAAEEIARQVRLRDLAGLVVIDFIDMEESKHQGQVERRLKEAMKSDRARIQIGRISPFGLLELSRQRLRPSLLENVTEICPHCEGTGRVRSVESTALHVLRGIDEEGVRRRAGEIVVKVPVAVALYLLNHKRANIAEIEQRYGFRVIVAGDDDLIPPHYDIERTRPRSAFEQAPSAMRQTASAQYDEFDDGPDDDVDGAPEAVANEEGAEDGEGNRRRRRKRRRRRRGGEGDVEGGIEPAFLDEPGHPAATSPGDEPRAVDGDDEARSDAAEDHETAAAGAEPDEADASLANSEDHDAGRRRRRGRRGGRGRRRESDDTAEAGSAVDGEADAEPVDGVNDAAAPVPEPGPQSAGDADVHAAAPEASSSSAITTMDTAPTAVPPSEPPPAVTMAPAEPPARPEAHSPPPASASAPAPQEAGTTPAEPPPTPVVPSIAVDAPPEKPKRGWWSRITS